MPAAQEGIMIYLDNPMFKALIVGILFAAFYIFAKVKE